MWDQSLRTLGSWGSPIFLPSLKNIGDVLNPCCSIFLRFLGLFAEASKKFGMTVDTDVSGWVKVKWDHGAEEKCRVGAEGKLEL